MLNLNTPMPIDASESLTPSEVLVTAGNARLLIGDCDGDRAIVRETWEMNVYRYHPRPNDIIVDVGAHRGIFSIWCAPGASVKVSCAAPPTRFCIWLNACPFSVPESVALTVQLWS